MGIELCSHIFHQHYQPAGICDPVSADHIQPHPHLICCQYLLTGNFQLLKLQVKYFAGSFPSVIPEKVSSRFQLPLKLIVKVQKPGLSVLNHNFLIVFGRHQLHIHPGKGFFHPWLCDINHLKFIFLKYIPEQCLRLTDHPSERSIYKPNGNGCIRKHIFYHTGSKFRILHQDFLRNPTGIYSPGHGNNFYLTAGQAEKIVGSHSQQLLKAAPADQIAALIFIDLIFLYHRYLPVSQTISLFHTENPAPCFVPGPGGCFLSPKGKGLQNFLIPAPLGGIRNCTGLAGDCRDAACSRSKKRILSVALQPFDCKAVLL